MQDLPWLVNMNLLPENSISLRSLQLVSLGFRRSLNDRFSGFPVFWGLKYFCPEEDWLI